MGAAPINLTAEQIDENGSVQVSWTAPSSPPDRYRITSDPSNTIQEVPSTSGTINLQNGVHNISVTSLFVNSLGESVGPIEITVQGTERDNVIRSNA